MADHGQKRPTPPSEPQDERAESPARDVHARADGRSFALRVLGRRHRAHRRPYFMADVPG